MCRSSEGLAVALANPGIEKVGSDDTGEWFIIVEFDDDPTAVERTTSHVSAAEAIRIVMQTGVSLADAEAMLERARSMWRGDP